MKKLPEFVIEKIHSAIKQDCGDVNPALNGEYGYALTEIAKAALEYAERNDEASEWGMSQLLRDSFYAIATVRRGTEPRGEAKKSEFNSAQMFWWRRDNFINYIKYSKEPKDSSLRTILPHLSSDEISRGVGLYLDLPIRSAKLDRFFVDILIASKVLNFLEYHLITVNEPRYSVSENGYVKVKHPFIRFLSALLKIAGYGGASIYILYLIEQSYKNTVALYMSLALISILGIVTFGWFIWLISELIELYFRRRNFKFFTPHMLKCYDLAGAAGPVSAKQMIEKLRETENLGVQWPPTVYALLDDIVSRTGRF